MANEPDLSATPAFRSLNYSNLPIELQRPSGFPGRLYVFFRFPFRPLNTAESKLDSEAWGRSLKRNTAPQMNRGIRMQDLLMLFFTAVFFGVAFLYVKACQKLR